MFIELAELGLYCVQQLGVMLGVGAQLIVLLLYLIAVKDGTVDSKEQYFLSATKRILYFGVICIVISGALITLIHFSQAQVGVVFSPAYLFKWFLIIGAIGLAFFDYNDQPSLAITKGLAGATWFGIFAIHILAPETTWLLLCLLFGTWVLGFMTLWLSVTFMLGGKSVFGDAVGETKSEPKKEKLEKLELMSKPEPMPEPEPALEPIPEQEAESPEEQIVENPIEVEPDVEFEPEVEPIPEPTIPPPKAVPIPPPVFVPPPMPKPALPAMPPMPKPAFSIPTASTKSPFISSPDEPLALHPHINENLSVSPTSGQTISAGSDLGKAQVTEHLPALRIMPQKPEDLETQHRAPLVRFG